MTTRKELGQPPASEIRHSQVTGVGVHVRAALLRHWPYLVMLAVALSIYAPGIFVPGGFFNYGDFSFPFNPEKRFEVAQSVLDYTIVPQRAPYYQGYLPALAAIYGLNSAGVPLWLINHGLLVFAAFIASVSVYLLSRTFIGNDRAVIPALLGAAFAVLNPSFIYHDPLLEISYAGIFLTLNFFVQGLGRPQSKRYYFIVPAASLLMVWNPLTFLIGVTVIFAYFILDHVFRLSAPRRDSIKYLATVSLLTFSLNMFWLGPPIVLQFAGVDVVYSYTNPLSADEGVAVLRQTSSDSSFSGSLTLSFNNCVWCFKFYENNDLAALRVLASLVPFVVGMWATVIKFHDANLRIFSLIAIALLVLSVGIHYSVTGNLYRLFWDSVPGFKGLRDTNHIFYTMSFVFSILLALGSYHLLSYFKGRKRKIVTLVLTALLLFNGSILYVSGSNQNFAAHEWPFFVPDDYGRLKAMLAPDADTGYRALILPLAGGSVTYDWYEVKRPKMTNILTDYIPLPVVGTATVDLENISYSKNIDVAVLLMDSSVNLDIAAKLLGNLGIKYIIMQHDIDNPELVGQALRYSSILGTRPDLFERAEGFTNFDVYVLKQHLVPSLRFVLQDDAGGARGDQGQERTRSLLAAADASNFRAVRLYDSKAYLVTPPSEPNNLSGRFTFLAWIKTPEIHSDGTLVSSSAIGASGKPAYSLALKDGKFVFSLQGKDREVVLRDSSPASLGQWHMISVSSNRDGLTMAVDGREPHFVQNDPENMPAYQGPSSIVLGGSPLFQNDGAAGFAYSKIFIYNVDIPPQLLQRIFLQGPPSDPDVRLKEEGISWQSWHFPAPGAAGEAQSATSPGAEIFSEDRVELPLEAAISESALSLLDARYEPGQQKISMRLPQLDYTIDTAVGGKVEGMVILNSNYDPMWKLTDSAGRAAASVQVSREWNVWSVTEDMTPPFRVKYEPADIIGYSFVLSVMAFGSAAALMAYTSRQELLAQLRRLERRAALAPRYAAAAAAGLVSSRVAARWLARLAPYALFGVMGLLFWYPNMPSDRFVLFYDATVHLNPMRELELNYFAWYDNDTGYPYGVSSQLALVAVEAVLHIFGVPLVTINHLFMFLSVTAGGWTMYYVMRRLVGGGRSGRVAAFAGGSLYMLGPLVATYALGTVIAMAYSLFPLFFYLAYKGLNSRGSELARAATLGIVLLAMSMAVQIVNIAIIVGLLLVAGTALVRRGRLNLKFLAYAAPISIAINAFWLVPLAVHSGEIFASYSPDINGHGIEGESAGVDISHNIRLIVPSYLPSFGGSPAGIALFALPAYCFAAVYLAGRKKLVYFVAALAVFSLVFSTGARYPVAGSIYTSIVGAFPQAFIALQNIDDYLFLALFSYSFLLAFTTARLAGRLPRALPLALRPAGIVRYAALAMMAVLVGASTIPSWTNVDGRTFNHVPGAKIPDEYLSLPEAIPLSSKLEGHRMLVLPWQEWYVMYRWYEIDESGNVVDIVQRISPIPTIGGYGVARGAVQELKGQIASGNPSNVSPEVLHDLGIKYIFVHKDLEITTSDMLILDPKYNERIAQALDAIKIADNDYFSLYELASSQDAISISGNAVQTINFKKANPVSYTGVVENDRDFILNLNQAYDNRWELILNDKPTNAILNSASLLDNLVDWSSEGTGRIFFETGKTNRMTMSADVQPASLGENYFTARMTISDPVALNLFNAIVLKFKIDGIHSGLSHNIIFYNSEGRFVKWQMSEEGFAGQYTTVEIPITSQIRDIGSIAAIAINFTNNSEVKQQVNYDLVELTALLKQHFSSNSGTNSWIIEPGSYEFSLYYGPQFYREVSVAITIIAFLFSTSILIISFVKPKERSA